MAPHNDRNIEAQMDFETLTRAQEIRNNPDRVRRAKAEAERRVQEAQQLKQRIDDEKDTVEEKGFEVLSRGI